MVHKVRERENRNNSSRGKENERGGEAMMYIIFSHLSTVALGACLSCLDMWKVRVPSVVPAKDMIGKLVLVKKISGKTDTPRGATP